jgi:hypothetical protein
MGEDKPGMGGFKTNDERFRNKISPSFGMGRGWGYIKLHFLFLSFSRVKVFEIEL